MSDSAVGARWQQVEELFHRALQAEGAAEERADRVRAWCADDPGLVAEVLSLLASADAVERSQSGRESKAPAHSMIGQAVGGYRIVGLIGRGGMGAVYSAMRLDGKEGDDQLVALKMLGARLVSPLARARFLEERRALAALQHARIARLLDGGVTDGGEPFFVMEYIRGERLDRHCERTQAGRDRILEIFLQLCDAVAYAHRNRILHGDLKPSNVLVSAEGEVKLLDFGAATLLNEARGGGSSSPVAAFTPEYASPEQIRGEVCNATADVYSLGVVLYRLSAGYVPSTVTAVISCTAKRQPGAESVSHPRQVAALDDAELRSVVEKAIDPDPERRYESVAALSADIRLLRENRPIAACRSTAGYRTKKFVRRNRQKIALAAILAATFIAGSIITLREANSARGEEARARRQIRDVRLLSTFMITDFYDRVARLPGSTAIQMSVAQEALNYLDGMARDARGDIDFELDLANAYTRMGNVLGSPYQDNLGNAPEAITSVTHAISIVRDALRARPDDPNVIRHAVFAEQSMSEIEFGDGKTPDALKHALAAAELAERLLRSPRVDVADLDSAATVYSLIGDEYGLQGASSMGQPEKAVASYHRGIAFSQAAMAKDPNDRTALRSIPFEEIKIANLLRESMPREAAAQYTDALTLLARIPTPSLSVERQRGIVHEKLADCYYYEGDIPASIAELRKAAAIIRSYSARDPLNMRLKQDLASIYMDEAENFEPLHRWNAARDAYARVVALLASDVRSDPHNRIWQNHYSEALISQAQVEFRLHRTDEAAANLRKGLAISVGLAESPDASPDDMDNAALHLLDVRAATLRNPREALRLASRAVARSNASDPEFVLTLARAQAACRQAGAARASIATILSLHPGADIRQSAEDLLKGLPPPTTDGASHFNARSASGSIVPAIP